MRTPEEWDAWHVPFWETNGRNPYWDELIWAIQADAVEAAALRLEEFGGFTSERLAHEIRKLKPSTAPLTEEQWTELTKDRP